MRLCIQCKKNPVQGCRCNIGYDYCKECKDAHPGPHKTFEEILSDYSQSGAERIYNKITDDILARVDYGRE